jgi:hypothetical protein
MLFETKKEEIEAALLREAFKQQFAHFSYDFPNIESAKEYAHVSFSWPIPRNGSPVTILSLMVPPQEFEQVDYDYVYTTVARALETSRHHGFDPTNPFSVPRVDRNYLH